jgi:hypothetical protein
VNNTYNPPGGPLDALDPNASNYIFYSGIAAARGETTGAQNESMSSLASHSLQTRLGIGRIGHWQERNSTMQHPEPDVQAQLPFEDEAKVLEDRAVTHDDITVVQTWATAAAQVSAEHVLGMLYSATPRYPFDPRSSPSGVRYHPAPGETEAEQR